MKIAFVLFALVALAAAAPTLESVLGEIRSLKAELSNMDDNASQETNLATDDSTNEGVHETDNYNDSSATTDDEDANQANLAVRSKAAARAKLQSEGEAVLHDIEAVKQDIALATNGDNKRTGSIGSTVQNTVDLVHCRNLRMAEEVYGKDSPEYMEELKKVVNAQKTMKGNFKLIAYLEKLLSFLTLQKKKPEEARLVKEGEDLVNPCERLGEQ
eukprot:comp24712_c0_seq1/m.60678 comp24712_c0_seq1/g.60678  ORF comp24712_c0_seq1/g.60678 comp24712_c0_seq1/m.60678 type:complete len:215 (-) comp24712_c0_seq1:214-858(-)